MEERSDILIIQTAFLGDTLLAIPLLKNLRLKFSDRNLILLARKGCGEVIKKLGLVNQVLEIDKRDSGNWPAIEMQLLSKEYDSVFSAHYSVRTQLLVRKLKANHKIGFKNFWNGFVFSHRVKRPMQLPDALRQASLLTVLDETFATRFWKWIDENPLVTNETSLKDVKSWGNWPIPEWASMNCAGQIKESSSHVVSTESIFLSPGSQWKTKRWPAEHWAKLIQNLVHEGKKIVLLGSPDEKPLVDEIVKASGANVTNLCGQLSIFETLQVMKRGKLLVTNDSGAMHMASVAGLPSLSIFGPTVLKIGFRPWNQSSQVIQRPLSCRPCGKHGSNQCPLSHHACMTAITPSDVMESVTSFAIR